MILVPFIILCSIVFAQVIWSMAPIPSSDYPYTEQIWELTAKNQTLLYSSTAGGYSQFREAFKPLLIAVGLGTGLGLFSVLKLLSAPVMLLYGLAAGLNQSLPHTLIPQFAGALLGRFYIERKVGKDWRRWAPVLTAGFFCGSGLITIFCIGVMFLSKSVFRMPY